MTVKSDIEIAREAKMLPIAEVATRGRRGLSAGMVQVVVESWVAGDGRPVLPRRRAPDLAGLAAFIMGPDGRVDSWPVTAERLFGHPAAAVIGRDLRDVLLTGPGQRERAGEAAEFSTMEPHAFGVREDAAEMLCILDHDGTRTHLGPGGPFSGIGPEEA